MPFSHAGPKRRLPDGKQLANDFPVCMVRNSCKQELWFHKHDLNTFELLHALWQKCVVRCQCVSAQTDSPKDTDNDGVVSAEEFRAARVQELRRVTTMQ